jgi:hypothetical protein
MLKFKLRTFVCLAALVAGPALAEAGWRNQRGDGGGVVAESRYGNGSVSGAVRDGRHGPEVRLPGGTWVGCRRSCSETLRVETVDFWENDGRLVGAGTASNECGVFGCLGGSFRF